MTTDTKPLPSPDPERIWLEPGMAWRQGWEMGEGGPGVEYVRADLYEQAQAELEEERLRSCRTCETAGAVVRRLELQLEKHRAGDAQEREALHDKVRDLEAVLAGVDWHWMSDPAEDDLESLCERSVIRITAGELRRHLAEAQQRAGLFEGLPEPNWYEWYRPDGKSLHVAQVGTMWAMGRRDDTLRWGTLAECLTALRSELQENSDE